MSLSPEIEKLRKVAEEMFEAIDNLKFESDEQPKAGQKKIIDLSKLVGSDVLCQFKDNIDDDWEEIYAPVKGGNTDDRYRDGEGSHWDKCRVAYNIWQPHMTDEQPIPDGYMVELMYNGGIKTEALESSGWAWAEMDIKAYRVVGVADGYKHEWEE